MANDMWELRGPWLNFVDRKPNKPASLILEDTGEFRDIETVIEVMNKNMPKDFQIVLGNVHVIKKYRKRLERIGVAFLPDFENNRRYMDLLRESRKNGHVYNMIKCSGKWAYGYKI